MDGASAIVGFVSLTIQIVDCANRVISTFERLQNAPQELRDFRASAKRLARHFQALQADLKDTSSLLDEDDINQIDDTLRLCKAIFDEHEEAQRRGLVNNILHGTWPLGNNDKLIRYRARIDEHYTTILTPLWLQVLSGRSRASNQNVRSGSVGNVSNETTKECPVAIKPLVPEEERRAIESLVKELKDVEDDVVVEDKLSDVDRRLRKCWGKLGLPHDDLDDKNEDLMMTAGLIGDRPRRPSLRYENARTLLKLPNAPPNHEKIRLERVHIMARDARTRILQYQDDTMSIYVTHIVPYGSIPLPLEGSHSIRVTFLGDQVITVVDEKGYHLYHVKPIYKFKTTQACDKFQSVLRERDLCGAFDTKDITDVPAGLGKRKVVVSRRQVVRFWRREENDCPDLLTMTYLQNSVGDGKQHSEVDISKFEGEPRIHGVDSVDLVPDVYQAPHRLRIRFDSAVDAGAFIARFRELRYEASQSGVGRLIHIRTQSAPADFFTPSVSSASTISSTFSSAPTVTTPFDGSRDPSSQPRILDIVVSDKPA